MHAAHMGYDRLFRRPRQPSAGHSEVRRQIEEQVWALRRHAEGDLELGKAEEKDNFPGADDVRSTSAQTLFPLQ